MYTITPLNTWPIADILAIQQQAYHDGLIEQGEVLLHKIHSAPLSLAAVKNGALCGYAIACPWHTSLAPVWNQSTPVAAPNCLYVHDIAIAPAHQGQGLAERLMRKVLELGAQHGFALAVGVAVQGAASYWQRLGFHPAPAPDVSSFGAGAVWLERTLP